jgi:hypothetical protein
LLRQLRSPLILHYAARPNLDFTQNSHICSCISLGLPCIFSCLCSATIFFLLSCKMNPEWCVPFFLPSSLCLFVYVLDNTSCMSCLESECHCWFSSW